MPGFDTLPKRDNRQRELIRGRITTREALPATTKARNIAEGIDAIHSGPIANRPEVGEVQEGLSSVYFATDQNKLYIYNASTSAWVSVTLS